MRLGLLLATLLTLASFALASGPGLDPQADASLPHLQDPVGERVYALVMDGNAFNAETWPDTPLLEAYAGERVHILVTVPPGAEMHTFHLHGHPWEDIETGDMIDTVLLHPSDVHAFSVTAGLGEGHDGDWLYHCHVTTHFNQGMWGLMRVYPHTVDVEGTLEDLSITLHDAQGDPVQDASFTLLHNPNAPIDPTPETSTDGAPIPHTATEGTPGAYSLQPDLPEGATGELVIQTHHPDGESLARLTLQPDGAYEENRHVGLDHIPRILDPNPTLPKGATPSALLDA